MIQPQDKPVIKSLIIEEDNKNAITIIEDVEVTDQFPDNSTHQSEIDDGV